MEIAQKLGVDQSMISDDLRYIRQEAEKNVVAVVDNLSFEFIKYLGSIDEIVRELWEIADTEIDPLANNNNNNANIVPIDPNAIISTNMNNKNRIAALSLLLQVYQNRIEAITGGTRSTRDFVGTTIMSHGHDIKEELKTPEARRNEKLTRIMNMS
jgi:hypothetical protein